MLDMRVRSLVMAASVLAAAGFFGGTAPASAQGGIVCAYGPASYQRCCAQSYKKNPRLSGSARARDIDACMAGGGKSKKKRG